MVVVVAVHVGADEEEWLALTSSIKESGTLDTIKGDGSRNRRDNMNATSNGCTTFSCLQCSARIVDGGHGTRAVHVVCS